MSASPAFRTGWCATDIGAYRVCESTYAVYAYESLPPLDETAFDGTFGWLGGTGDVPSARAADITELAGAVKAVGLQLPGDFAAFHGSAELAGSLDEVSVTCCWTSLSEPIPSRVEEGAYLVRFLRDQQDCVFWYLYLRPSGETFVVFSHLDLEHLEEYEGWEAAVGDGTVAAAIFWCAPAFEVFAHRFWTENRLWHHVHNRGESEIEPGLQAYLDHYPAPEAAA